MSQPEFHARAWLVKNGVPIETAFTLDSVWSDALGLAFGELQGRTWDWSSRSWKEAAP